ncbi:MAG: hypothetical protein A2249_00200 [Candidatus Jacksonbacteria bacterium RIFOXYA2_FULL_44_7]|uniref:SSD domain-containing protein n=1 Tax=Candidatus Jacksonbacteria bacterium RIFCSPLOWO2_02_FULL_44_20 TaxID=1798460 RepID=A0A1G2A7M5_9BACT|nr:MAG: hypothetical protein UW39_C0002G0033 [Parcubacteria group bacterium GW2011_GWC2_44_17]KKT50072.1 MAG: hypothetical protein UW40_C0010G0023 [Parcubacteria group bacterium GW2011_GWF2_44_17]OGY69497.1 MAG: hypothetical protein A3C00_00345 [Candidatus Jacksonbacteria bacterium RIFCSPHIGHO2_02_FULL_44_25]OGY71530.1 MAG: hypothetical protein A3E05_04220 [Candidatus Jacksonbacteria bacterium RIFCSPHIGHO2_12_FULL_44_12]OGY72781.1 MAG: hypothetical protein A3H61_02405 [Candidatus Jacksonbacteri
MNIKQAINYPDLIQLAILAGAVAFSPRFTAGMLSGGRPLALRIEDIALLIFCSQWIIQTLAKQKTNFRVPPFFTPLLILTAIEVVSTLINLAIGTLNPLRALFFTMKDIEYMILFLFVFSKLGSRAMIEAMLKIWVLISIVASLWIGYQIITGVGKGYYFASGIGEISPFSVGGSMLILSIYISGIFLFSHLWLPISKKKKISFGLLALALAASVLATLSRTAILGLAFALGLLVAGCIAKIKKSPSMPAVVMGLLFASTVIIATFVQVPNLFKRMQDFSWHSSSITVRYDHWKNQISSISRDTPYGMFIGMGKSALVISDESHNQYVQYIVETGLLGLLSFLLLIAVIVKESYRQFAYSRDPLIIALSSGLLVTTIIMLSIVSLSSIPFRSVRVAEIYWFFAAITAAVWSTAPKPLKTDTENHDQI